MAQNASVIDVISSSEDESDGDVPDAAVCQKLIDEFVAVTNRDSAFAQMYLQQRGWELQRALNDFFNAGGSAKKPSSNSTWLDAAVSRDRRGRGRPTFQVRTVTLTEPAVIGIDDDDMEVEEVSRRKRPRTTEVVAVDSDSDSDSVREEVPDGTDKKVDPNEVRPSSAGRSVGDGAGSVGGDVEFEEKWDLLHCLSWNIDGLEHKNVEARAKCVAKHILDLKIDFAFLQEVTVENLAVLKEELKEKYLVITSRALDNSTGQMDYVTAFCIRKSSKVEYKSQLWRPFPGSVMRRGLQIAKAVVKKHGSLPEFSISLVNAHLESTKDYAKERKVQLKRSFAVAEDLSRQPKTVCVFAGDLNVRDNEVVEVGVPKCARDMWEACGAKDYLRYTWDCRRNTNCQLHNPKSGPRLRFDRAYVAQQQQGSAAAPVVVPEHFGFQGLLKVPGRQCFPSDHWALYFVLKRVPDPRTET